MIPHRYKGPGESPVSISYTCVFVRTCVGVNVDIDKDPDSYVKFLVLKCGHGG